MANHNLFKEAIAEAKLIRESAIANARVAIEEELTPHLRSLISQRLMEMEKEEEGEVVSEEEEVEEAVKAEEEIQTEASDKEAEEKAEDDSEKSEDEADKEGSEEDSKEEEEAEEDIEVKDMEIEDLKNLIRDMIAQEMQPAGTGEEEGEFDASMDASMDGEAQPDDMVSAEDEEINLEELLEELEKMSEKDSVEEAKKTKDDKKEVEKVKKELKEALNTISTLKNELSEINLLNAKLLYLNKVFKSNNLSESQKTDVVSAFDKASSIKEVQLIYEATKNTFKDKGKHPLKENRGFASKATGTAPKKEVITEVNEQILRMQKLAGIIK